MPLVGKTRINRHRDRIAHMAGPENGLASTRYTARGAHKQRALKMLQIGCSENVALAWRFRQYATASLPWVAERLRMGITPELPMQCRWPFASR
jgi:hypothetical protein